MSVTRRQLEKATDILSERVGPGLDIQTMIINVSGAYQWVYLYTEKIGPEVQPRDRGPTAVSSFEAEVASHALAESAFQRWPKVVVYASSHSGLTELKRPPPD